MPNQNVSILNGPVSGQKNIVGNNMTQVVTAARDFELEQIRETNRVQGSGLHTGRDYMTHPNELDIGRTNNHNNQIIVNRIKPRKNSSAQRSSSNKGRPSSKSASRERSRDRSNVGYSLQELEKREASLQQKIANKKQKSSQRQ